MHACLDKIKKINPNINTGQVAGVQEDLSPEDDNGNPSTSTVLGKRKAVEPINMPNQGAKIPLSRMTELRMIADTLATGTLTLAENGDIFQAVFANPIQVGGGFCELGPGEEDRFDAEFAQKIKKLPDPRNYEFVASLQDRKRGMNSISKECLAAAMSSAKIQLSCCTREHNATMLRSPNSYERPCGCNDECVSLSELGFIMREFLTPDIEQEIKTKGRRTVQPETGPCLICCRHIYYIAHMSSYQEGLDESIYNFPQFYSNPVDVAGQYVLSSCIPVLTGFSLPIVMNNFNMYEVRVDSSGTKWVLETYYPKPQSNRNF